MKYFLILLIFVCVFGTVYAVPPLDPEAAFRYSEIVIVGKILSVEILSEPQITKSENSYSEISGIALYKVQIEKYLKNPSDASTIIVPGEFLREPHPMSYETYPYEVGQRVLLYIQKNDIKRVESDLIIRSGHSKVIDETKYESFSLNIVNEEPIPNEGFDNEQICEPGTAPIGNYVFFDCKWVEIPDHWNFVDGKWKEDPSVLKLGPEPKPNCPDVDVCTCPGKFGYYNFTDKRCHSSPYIPEFYQKACTQYSKMEFAGWTFDENQCEWGALSSPYDDERLRLASEKVGVGGLGIDPEVDLGTILVGVAMGVGIALGLIFYLTKRK